jgi:hypothetical protein
LRRPSHGTRWTNEQLLFHMLFGYLIMRALLTLVRLFSRFPAGVSRTYARFLNAATTPFDAVNHVGSSLGGTYLGRDRMAAMFDRVITVLHRRLDTETDATSSAGCTNDSMGSLFLGVYDARRRLPLPYPAFRLPPPPTQPG